MIPHVCEVVVDCRLLPGQTQAEVEPLLRGVLGEGDYDFEWIEGRGGTRSALETPLWDAVESFVAEVEPEATVLPVCVAGFTDSHWLREAFGTVAYGFFPMRTMDPQLAARLIHSADERIAVDDLELAVRCFRHVAVAGDAAPARLFSRWRTRSASEGWRSSTACSCTGRAPGPARSARPTGELKVESDYKRLRAAGVSNPLLRGPGQDGRSVRATAAGSPAAAGGAAPVPAAAGARRDGRDAHSSCARSRSPAG